MLLTATIYSCNKDDTLGPPSSLTELIDDIKLESRDTAITLRWRKALTAWEGDTEPTVRYEVNVSSDPEFEDESQQVLALETDSPFVSLNQQQLVPLQEYYARVRSIAGPNNARSNWLESKVFMILDEVPEVPVLKPVKAQEITDEVAIVHWGDADEYTITHLVLTADGQEGEEIQLSGDELSDRAKTIEGLTSNQAYTVQLFAGERSMGTQTFATKPSIDDLDAVVDLRGSSGSDALLQAVNTAAEGSTIVLSRGSVHTISSMLLLERSVTIMSEPGFDAPARLDFSGGGWMDIADGSTIDHIVLNEIEVIGDVESTYVMNVGNGTNVGRIVLENCLVTNHRGTIRIKNSNTVLIDEIAINNSLIQHIGGYGVVNVDNNAATVNNVRLTNSTVNNAQLILRSRTDGQSITIENVTFYNAPFEGYLIDYNGVSISATIRNSLFGLTSSANAVRADGSPLREVENSFATSDFDGDLASGIEVYSKASRDVFSAPDDGDFTIIDDDLSMLGDPRWR